VGAKSFKCPAAEIGDATISPAEIGPAEISPAEIGSAEIGLTEIGLAEIGPAEIGLAEVCCVNGLQCCACPSVIDFDHCILSGLVDEYIITEIAGLSIPISFTVDSRLFPLGSSDVFFVIIASAGNETPLVMNVLKTEKLGKLSTIGRRSVTKLAILVFHFPIEINLFPFLDCVPGPRITFDTRDRSISDHILRCVV
jgi:hypothetical protein